MGECQLIHVELIDRHREQVESSHRPSHMSPVLFGRLNT